MWKDQLILDVLWEDQGISFTTPNPGHICAPFQDETKDNRAPHGSEPLSLLKVSLKQRTIRILSITNWFKSED